MLNKLLKSRYKLQLDLSWKADGQDPDGKIWNQLITCQGGAFIYLHSLADLNFVLYCPGIRRASIIAKKVIGCRLERLNGEALIHFPLKLLPEIARAAGAKQKRRLSEAHKAKLRKVGRATRFKSKFHGSNEDFSVPD